MLVITSASYIEQDFGSEFGRLPPAFLPVGNRRLFQHQARTLPEVGRIVLTVPESYEVSGFDRRDLDALGIELMPIPDGLSLGDSVVCAINLSGNPPDAPLRILHGDTVIVDLPGDALDVVTLSRVDGAYNWAVWHDEGDTRLKQLDEQQRVGRARISNGYFAFSNCGAFVRGVLRNRGSFVEGINAYARELPLRGLEVQHWYDFGHAHTYYRSKARMTTERTFNSLEIDAHSVRKTSRDAAKMRAEHAWFQGLPAELRMFTPQVLRAVDAPEVGYELQYLYLASLNELFVFGGLPRFVWREILGACFSFIDRCAGFMPAPGDNAPSDDLFGAKTRRRLAEWTPPRGLSLEQPCRINGRDVPSINDIVEATAAEIPALDASARRIVHGDLCFSNILYDFRSQSIRVIDPRGCATDGTPTLYGDPRYDLAKLAHSVVGLYDFIVAGHYEFERDAQAFSLRLPESPNLTMLGEEFVSEVEARYGVSGRALMAMQVHLFLSMIPLHGEDEHRQLAFLANALRLFEAME